MQITAPGRYKLNKDFIVHGSMSVGTLPAGTEITITQIDAEAHKVIGPELGDWHHWEIPAVHLDKPLAKPAHTATPWALNRNEIPPLIYAPLGNGQGEPCIALLDGNERCWAFPDVLTQTANAEFIVRAVNAHDELVKALQTIGAQSIGKDWTAEQAIEFVKQHARAALANASAA